MKCPHDQTEMERGSLVINGGSWVSEKNWLTNLLFVRGWRLGRAVFAWRCPKCGKIELYSPIAGQNG